MRPHEGKFMQPASKDQAIKLEDIPNIGKSIASDLRAIGILRPQQLAAHKPLATYFALAERMGRRHDPCVFYVLMAAQHYLQSGEAVPWWKFTEQGRMLLAPHPNKHPR
jgi:DNA transformation protein